MRRVARSVWIEITEARHRSVGARAFQFIDHFRTGLRATIRDMSGRMGSRTLTCMVRFGLCSVDRSEPVVLSTSVMY